MKQLEQQLDPVMLKQMTRIGQMLEVLPHPKQHVEGAGRARTTYLRLLAVCATTVLCLVSTILVAA